MEEYTLVVLAAGLGSRFGGLKQTTPVGPNGEFIIDYSIYDAIKAGFNKVVFIIRKEHEDLFRETIGSRIDGKIKVEYAFQDVKDVPEGYIVPEERTKPWGTGHALYAAREFIKGPFAIINADDFYGAEAFELLMDFLKNNETRNHYITVCYNVKNTLSVNGSVKSPSVINTIKRVGIEGGIDSMPSASGTIYASGPSNVIDAEVSSGRAFDSVDIEGLGEKIIQTTQDLLSGK